MIKTFEVFSAFKRGDDDVFYYIPYSDIRKIDIAIDKIEIPDVTKDEMKNDLLKLNPKERFPDGIIVRIPTNSYLYSFFMIDNKSDADNFWQALKYYDILESDLIKLTLETWEDNAINYNL